MALADGSSFARPPFMVRVTLMSSSSFRMANRGLVALPGGERWLTVAWVGDVVRSISGGHGR